MNGLILTWYDADELDITVHSARDAIVERSLDPDQRRLETFCALECDGRALGCGNYLAFRLRRMPTAGEGVVLQAVFGKVAEWPRGLLLDVYVPILASCARIISSVATNWGSREDL